MGGLVRGRLLIWGDAMCLRARIRSFKPPQLHFLPFYHNLEVDKDCLVTQFCLFCIVTSLKILASYTLLPLLMYSCKFQLRNSIFIILYTITCALNDQSCRCAIKNKKQHSQCFLCLLTFIFCLRSCLLELFDMYKQYALATGKLAFLKTSDIHKPTEYTGNLVLTLIGICHFPALYDLYTWENKRFVLSQKTIINF